MTLLTELRTLLEDSAVLTEQADMAGFTEDWRGRYRGPALCVAMPSTTEEVAAVVRACVAHRTPVVPQGGNTSLCGGSVPGTDGTPPVIVSLRRMRRVRHVDAVNNSMEVEAGCVLAAVQQAAVEVDRLYPVSLGAEGSCQIGGNIATNAGGTGVLRYGNTRDNVLGLEVVLPDGAIWDGRYLLRKNNTGLDLKHLFIGSEGTMGIVTAATLKLHPLPRARSVAWVAPASPAAAVTLLGLVQSRCGSMLSAFELINGEQLRMVMEQLPDRRAPLGGTHDWHLLIELSGSGDDATLDQLLQDVLAEAADTELVHDAVIAASGAQQAALWEVRHSVSEANKKAGVGLTTDCAVPISAAPEFIVKATEAVRALVPGLPVLIVAHLGDGNVHFIPFFGWAEWEAAADRDALGQRLKHAVNEVAHALKGTFSAEHGIGRTLIPEMAHFKSPVELSMMRLLKRQFDPLNLFNPGRLVPGVTGVADVAGASGFLDA
jgi:FAD/FMN-containing dehydrogenase